MSSSQELCDELALEGMEPLLPSTSGENAYQHSMDMASIRQNIEAFRGVANLYQNSAEEGAVISDALAGLKESVAILRKLQQQLAR